MNEVHDEAVSLIDFFRGNMRGSAIMVDVPEFFEECE